MKAIVQDAYGSADVLKLEDIDRPAIGDAEVLVRVQAASVDPGVWHLMTGLPYFVRLMGLGLRTPRFRVRGMALAGCVEAIGKDVTGVRPGDEVYGAGEGSLAEFARARADRLAAKPANLTFEQAAAAPISGVTALQGLRDAARVQPGQSVLIIGAAGGVGSFAVQIGKALGAAVTGVCGPDKLDLVRSLGADEVIDYTRGSFTDGARRWDVILDMAGQRPLSELRRALVPKGRLVIVGGEGGSRWFGGFQRQIFAPLFSPFYGVKLISLMAVERTPDLNALTALIEAGRVTPVIDRTYPLSEAAEAMRYLEKGHARGKIVISV